MADSLLDTYLGTGKPVDKEDQQPVSLLDTYLPSAASVSNADVPSNIPRITVTPRVPTVDEPNPPGYTQQELDTAAKTDRNKVSLSDVGSALALPVEDYASNVAKDFKSGVGMATEGLGALTRNAPAEGAGKIGMGLLNAAASPVTAGIKTGIEDPVTQLTGNPDIGKRAGLVAGLGLPIIKGGQFAKANIPTNKAVSAIIDTIGKDNIADTVAQLKANPRLSVMDVVPATRQMAQKLITTEGQHQNKFEAFVNDRVASGKGATSDIYDSTMGVPVNVVDKVNQLKQAARNVGKNEIEPALAQTSAVDITPVTNYIDSKLKPGVNSVISKGEPLPLGDLEKPLAAVRKFLTDDKSFRTDPNSLHQFQSALRAKADDLLNSQSGQDRQLGGALMNVRNRVVDAIDKASGGTYKSSLSKYKDEMDVQNAFNMGQLVTRNKLGRLEDAPEFWDNWVKQASPSELEAAREGARLAVQQQIAGFKAGARKGQDIVESEFNKQKLSSLFGKDEVDQMSKLLKDERNISITNSKLIDNSQTAMRMKADSRVDLPDLKQSSLIPYVAAGAELAGNIQGIPGVGLAIGGASIARRAFHKYATLPLAKAKNSAISDLLTATGDDREALIKILESHIPQPKQSLITKARNLALPVLPP